VFLVYSSKIFSTTFQNSKGVSGLLFENFQHHISKLSRCFWSTFRKFPAPRFKTLKVFLVYFSKIFSTTFKTLKVFLVYFSKIFSTTFKTLKVFLVYFSKISSTTFQNSQGVSGLLFENFQHHTKLRSKCYTLLVSSLKFNSNLLLKRSFFLNAAFCHGNPTFHFPSPSSIICYLRHPNSFNILHSSTAVIICILNGCLENLITLVFFSTLISIPQHLPISVVKLNLYRKPNLCHLKDEIQ